MDPENLANRRRCRDDVILHIVIRSGDERRILPGALRVCPGRFHVICRQS